MLILIWICVSIPFHRHRPGEGRRWQRPQHYRLAAREIFGTIWRETFKNSSVKSFKKENTFIWIKGRIAQLFETLNRSGMMTDDYSSASRILALSSFLNRPLPLVRPSWNHHHATATGHRTGVRPRTPHFGSWAMAAIAIWFTSSCDENFRGRTPARFAPLSSLRPPRSHAARRRRMREQWGYSTGPAALRNHVSVRVWLFRFRNIFLYTLCSS